MQETAHAEAQRLAELVREQIPQQASQDLAGRFALPEAGLPVYPVQAFFCDDPREFLFRCYSALLGRLPDPQGLQGGMDKLRGGTGAMRLLWQIRHSAEGSACGVRVRGLRLALLAERYRERPLLAALARRLGLMPPIARQP